MQVLQEGTSSHLLPALLTRSNRFAAAFRDPRLDPTARPAQHLHPQACGPTLGCGECPSPQDSPRYPQLPRKPVPQGPAQGNGRLRLKAELNGAGHF